MFRPLAILIKTKTQNIFDFSSSMKFYGKIDEENEICFGFNCILKRQKMCACDYAGQRNFFSHRHSRSFWWKSIQRWVGDLDRRNWEFLFLVVLLFLFRKWSTQQQSKELLNISSRLLGIVHMFLSWMTTKTLTDVGNGLLACHWCNEDAQQVEIMLERRRSATAPENKCTTVFFPSLLLSFLLAVCHFFCFAFQ